MKNRRFRKTLVMMLIFVLVMSNFMSAITIATSSEFKLSDSAGNPVQGNHYALKTDVYMYSTTMPDGNYYIKVTSPGGTGNLGVTSNPDVEVINGVFPLTQLWSLIHYADTTNNGGQYKVHMNTDSNFPGSSNFTKTFTVGEVLLGTVSGVKFNDLNANNVKDSGEPGLGQWTIMAVLSTNSNTFYTTTTAQDGSYSFNLPVGTWIISEVQQAGWTQSFPTSGSYQITVVGNDTFTDKDFGNWAAITKTGYKFNDLNGNGVWDEGELGLPGFTIYVDYNDNGLLDEGEPSAITTADGSYTISGIVPGTWKVNELEMIGWTQTYPEGGFYEETFVSGMVSEGNDFGNWADITKSGFKFNDLNGNSAWDDGEPGLQNWVIFVDYNDDDNLGIGEPSATTDSNGFYTISGIVPGTWKVKEIQQLGWTQTYPEGGFYIETFISGDELTENIFGNWADITKSGYKFNDLNGNGVWDEGEPGLAGFTIFVDYDGDGVLDDGEPSAITGLDGSYTISGIVPGTWEVREVQQSGWTQTYPEGSFYEETFISGMMSEENNFGNMYDDSLEGGIRIFKDVPNIDDDLTYFDYNIYSDSGLTQLVTSLSGTELVFVSTIVPVGTYYVHEVPESGYSTTTDTFMVIVADEEFSDVYFVNTFNEEPPEPWLVHGYVFYDENGNNTKDAGESGFAGIELYLDGNLTPAPPVTTDSDGYYEWAGIPGTSHDVVVTVESTVPADYEISEYDGSLNESVEV
ncbi:MAG: SdrD B-like domain-containing protein, partial [Bacillota bacterium]|nr:SdrD B-like domain-containing protein [Bacillota bacterium]